MQAQKHIFSVILPLFSSFHFLLYIFQQAFGVGSTQMLVKIYNSCLTIHFAKPYLRSEAVKVKVNQTRANRRKNVEILTKKEKKIKKVGSANRIQKPWERSSNSDPTVCSFKTPAPLKASLSLSHIHTHTHTHTRCLQCNSPDKRRGALIQ